jgi:hypothetical protein
LLAAAQVIAQVVGDMNKAAANEMELLIKEDKVRVSPPSLPSLPVCDHCLTTVNRRQRDAIERLLSCKNTAPLKPEKRGASEAVKCGTSEALK